MYWNNYFLKAADLPIALSEALFLSISKVETVAIYPSLTQRKKSTGWEGDTTSNSFHKKWLRSIMQLLHAGIVHLIYLPVQMKYIYPMWILPLHLLLVKVKFKRRAQFAMSLHIFVLHYIYIHTKATKAKLRHDRRR